LKLCKNWLVSVMYLTRILRLITTARLYPRTRSNSNLPEAVWIWWRYQEQVRSRKKEGWSYRDQPSHAWRLCADTERVWISWQYPWKLREDWF
jgi:hypothetical protein